MQLQGRNTIFRGTTLLPSKLHGRQLSDSIKPMACNGAGRIPLITFMFAGPARE